MYNFMLHGILFLRYILLDIKEEKVYALSNIALWYYTAKPKEQIQRQNIKWRLLTMKNNNAYEKFLQTLTEAQRDMLDVHEEQMEKARKGKENYVAIARTRETAVLREGKELYPLKGVQAIVATSEKIVAMCRWTAEDGMEKYPLSSAIRTNKSGKISASIFIRGGSMKAPIITDAFGKIEPDAEYKVMIHIWGEDTGYLWMSNDQTRSLTRTDYLIINDMADRQNPVKNSIEKLMDRCYFQKPVVEGDDHE